MVKISQFGLLINLKLKLHDIFFFFSVESFKHQEKSNIDYLNTLWKCGIILKHLRTQLRFCGILFKVMSQPRCVASLTAFSCWRAGAKLMTLRMKPGECNQIRAMAGAASRKLRMVTNCGCILPWSRGYRGLTVVLW